MGGLGSGSYSRSSNAKLDGGLRLDINWLKQRGYIGFNTRHTGSLKWTWTYTEEDVGSIGFEINTLDPHNMWLRIHYEHSSYYSDEPEKMDYKIRLTTTRPYYGGKRLWFVCPLTHRRAGVLYSPSGSKWFASRYAFDLKYQSQSKSARNRAIDKMWKLRNKLQDDDEYYLKPKGMHWRTFDRLCDKIEEAERGADFFLYKDMMKYMLA